VRALRSRKTDESRMSCSESIRSWIVVSLFGPMHLADAMICPEKRSSDPKSWLFRQPLLRLSSLRDPGAHCWFCVKTWARLRRLLISDLYLTNV
jgi:hypothetical protein